MKDLLNFAEGMYKYAFSIKNDGNEVHISPAILSNDYTKLDILPIINTGTPISEIEDIAKTFTEDILKEHFFKANSKLDFLNKIRAKNVINYIDEDEFNNLIKDDESIDRYLEDVEGYTDYIDGDDIYIIYESACNDTPSVTSLSLIIDILNSELGDTYFHKSCNLVFNNEKEQLDFNKTLVKENKPLIDEIYKNLINLIETL